MAGPAPGVARPGARVRGAAPGGRGAGRDPRVPTLRAPYVHHPGAAARARAGGAAACGRHAAGPGPGRRSPGTGAGRSGARARVPALAARRGSAGHDAGGEPRRGGPAPSRAAASGGRPAVGVAAARAPRGGRRRVVWGTRPARLGRRGAAAGDGGHPEPPARLAPDRAQAALLDRERGGGEVRDRRVEHLHRADPHPDRGAGAARKPVAAGELRRVAAGAPARGHADGLVAGGAARRDDGPVQEVREGAAGAEAGGAGVRAPGAWGYDRGSGGYAGPVDGPGSQPRTLLEAASSSLFNAASFPTTYSNSFTGSDTVPPVSAMRIGWKTFPAATPRSSAWDRKTFSNVSGVHSAVFRTSRVACSDVL